MFSPTTTFLRILETFHEEKRGKESYFRRVELREEMLIRTIGKRKFHEESFSSDFFFFFFRRIEWFGQLLALSYGQFPRRLLLRITNSFCSHSIGIHPNEGWMESWKSIKHRTMPRVDCRRITPSDYPLKRKRKLEIATVRTIDISVSFRLCDCERCCKNRFIRI